MTLDNLDFGDVGEGFEPLDEGVYNVMVDEVSVEDGPKAQYLKITYIFTEEPYHSQKRNLWDNVSLSPQARWKLKQVLEALTGEDWDKDGMKLDPKNLIGCTAQVVVYQDNYTDTKTGREKITNKIDEYLTEGDEEALDLDSPKRQAI